MQAGIELAHKPEGVTSFSLVEERLALMAKQPGKPLKICHGGSLDPFASGLMLILLGEATKIMAIHHGVPKVYVAKVKWGAETDNGDPLGRVIHEGDASKLTAERLDEALKPFLGWTEQVPPLTSNKRVDGERAWAKAHRGEVFELPPSRVYLHDAVWRSHDLPHSSVLELRCRGGYYVRSLAKDLGRALGCYAHLSALHRTEIGPWRDPAGGPVHLSGQQLLPWCDSRELTDHEVGELRAEREIELGKLGAASYRLPDGWPDVDAPVRAFHLGKLVGLLDRTGELLRARQLFRRGV